MRHYPQALVRLDALKDDPENPMIHGDAEIARLRAVIEEVGFIQPIAVDSNTMMILAGHGRVEAARLLSMTEVPALLVDDYDANKRRLALIGTNGNYGHFDDDALTALLRELESSSVDLDLSGIEPFRLDELLPAGGSAASGDLLGAPADGRYREQYGVIVVCLGEAEQKEVYDRLTAEGLSCKVVTT